MTRLIVGRLLALIPTALVVTFGVYMMISLIPGNIAVQLAGGETASLERVEEVEQQLGLDDPLLVQYGRWVGDAATGDLGTSLRTNQPILDEIGPRFSITLSLAIAAMAVSLVVALPVGILAGMRPGGIFDRVALVGTSLALSIPPFWFAMLLISAFAVTYRIFPSLGLPPFTQDPWLWVKSVALPALAIGVRLSASVARQLRAAIMETLDAPYIRTAWAKGAGVRRVVVGHALKNAAIPVVTVIGLQFGAVLGGTVIIEEVFAIPGLGQYFLQAVLQQDVPVIQGVVLLFVMIQLVVWLATDIAYGLLDPKVRAQ